MKEGPASVPERRRPDPTAFVPSAEGAGRPASDRELVATGASVASLLAEVKRTPRERLEVERELARGGMGTIEVAIDRALDRRVAMKSLHPHLRGEEQACRMFLREARLTGLLEHPHIVPIYDIGERDGGGLYFTMKLVEGRTLADAIRELPPGPLDVSGLYWAIEIVLKVCDALAFAHSRGVIHCDVKPANVMIGEFGQVYLMDWGIARLLSGVGPRSTPRLDEPVARPHTTDHAVIGTPSYMSPEQARGDRAELDARSDVFMIGGLLYEILTRRPPYASLERAETIALAAACSFPPPRVAGGAAIPEELERIVLRAMAARPQDRYTSVADLRNALLRFTRGGAEFPRRTVEAGEVIVREGDASDAAYILVAGACEIRKRSDQGTEEVLAVLGPGAVFGEMAILSSSPRTATVVATERSTLLVVTSDVLEHEILALKPWMAALLKSLAARFFDLGSRPRTTATQAHAPARLANQLLMHLESWGARDASGALRASLSSTLAEIEAQLGAAPTGAFALPSLYREIHYDLATNAIVVRDPAALKAKLREDLA